MKHPFINKDYKIRDLLKDVCGLIALGLIFYVAHVFMVIACVGLHGNQCS